jgi:hypothetical protein
MSAAKNGSKLVWATNEDVKRFKFVKLAVETIIIDPYTTGLSDPWLWKD